MKVRLQGAVVQVAILETECPAKVTVFARRDLVQLKRLLTNGGDPELARKVELCLDLLNDSK